MQDKREDIRNLIAKLEKSIQSQTDTDGNYNDFVCMIKQEMHQKVNHKNIKIRIGLNNKKRRIQKPWWSEELTVIWNELCVKEKKYVEIRY